jgi:prepilin-type processing-associated H-X9-DG protein
VGVAGSSIGTNGDIDGPRTGDGILYWRSKVRMGDIQDGTSMTAIVGERPPSPDLYWGWWFTTTTPNGTDHWWDMDALMGTAERFNHTDLPNTSGSNPNIPCVFSGPPEYLARYARPGPPSVATTIGTPSNNCDFFRFWSNHLGGAQWAFADGSVRMIPYTSNVNNRKVIRAIGTKAGSTVIDESSLDYSFVP